MITNEEVKDWSKHFKNKETFKELWVNSLCNLLGKNDEEVLDTLGKKYEEHFEKRNVLVRNTYIAKDFLLDPFLFVSKCLKDWILFENGGIFLKHEKMVDITITLLDAFIDTRTYYKKGKLKALEEDNHILAAIYKIIETIAKIIINGYYGLSVYRSSPQFNLLVGDSCTAASRSFVCLGGLTSEYLGIFRNYNFMAHIKSIEMVKKEIEEKPFLGVTFKNVSVEDTLKWMLGPHYDTYYMKSALRETLTHQSQEVLNRLYYKHNFREFLELPEIDKLHKELMEIWGTKFINDEGKEIECQFLNTRKPLKPFQHLIDKLKDYTLNIIYGTYWYEGDNYEGIYYQTPVDIVENMKRYKVASGDTDAVLTTSYDEIQLMYNKYSKLAKNQAVLKYSIPTLADFYHITLISKTLWDYAIYRGIDKSYLKYIIMEDESLFSQIHLTNVKKNYIGLILMEEGKIIDDKEITIRGLPLKKSNFNAMMSKDVRKLIEHNVMVGVDKINLNYIVKLVKELTSKYRKMFQDEKSILDIKDVSKLNEELSKTNYGDFRRKAIELHNRLFKETPISIPGAFSIINIKFTPELLEKYKTHYPAYYKVICEYGEEIYWQSCLNKIYTRLNKIYDLKFEEDKFGKDIFDYIPELDNNSVDEAFEYCNSLINEYSNKINDFKIDYFEELRVKMLQNKIGFKIINNISIPKLNLQKIIIDKITRCAVHEAAVDLYDFFKVFDYEIVDASIASTVETLSGPVLASTSISIPKNKQGKFLVSNVIDSY